MVAHGDYCRSINCLPNVLFGSNLELTGFIDLGRPGVSDRYRDLALANRSRKDSFDESIVNLFFQEYGLPPDDDLIQFYLLVDELF